MTWDTIIEAIYEVYDIQNRPEIYDTEVFVSVRIEGVTVNLPVTGWHWDDDQNRLVLETIP